MKVWTRKVDKFGYSRRTRKVVHAKKEKQKLKNKKECLKKEKLNKIKVIHTLIHSVDNFFIRSVEKDRFTSNDEKEEGNCLVEKISA